MPSVAEVAEPLAAICRPVPTAGPGICHCCHRPPLGDYQRCYSCVKSTQQVSRPCRLVVPVSLYDIPSQLHHYLRHYKSGHFPRRQREFGMRVAALLGHFLNCHRACIAAAAGGDWEVMTAVPSSGGRSGEHPLVSALRAFPDAFDTYATLLHPGDVAVGHNHAHDDGFRPIRPVRGERILVVDDTFTSGARAQSAASALALAGAEVVAIVPVGRVIDASHKATAEWWDHQRRQRFDFGVCCLEAT